MSFTGCSARGARNADEKQEAVWQLIKRWDINVPDVYSGYMGANGNHVRAILDVLMPSLGQLIPLKK